MSVERLLVKVAVFDIFEKNHQILLILRQNTGYRDGYWTFPAGHVDPGESPSIACVREGYEETGVIIESFHPAHVIFRRKSDDHTPYIDIYYEINKFQGEPRIPIAEINKCADMKWFPENNLPTNLVPGIAMALANIEKGIPYSEITED